MTGTLYVVATPIGNLEDITQRALRILGEVDLIAAEDTRHSRKLLDHFGIERPLTSYHDHSERTKAPQLIERLREGKDVALICDAGTPGIADPGYRLVCAAIDAQVPVVPIPGPSALTACLSVAGLPTDRVAFEGFVPARAGARRRFYESLANETRTLVVFEAGRRLVESLRDLDCVLGRRRVAVGREVTKMFESFVRGDAAEVADALEETAVRGEVTVVIEGATEKRRLEAQEVVGLVTEMRGSGMRMKEIAKSLTEKTGWSSREIYDLGIGKTVERD